MPSDVSSVKRILSSKYTATAILLIISIGVYLNTLPNGFVFDDKNQVLKNLWIRDAKYIPEIFLTNVWAFMDKNSSNYYRPLMHIIYMIDYHIFGLKPWGFHLTNIIFHAGVTLLVYLIASMLINQSLDLNSKSQIPNSKSKIQNPKSKIINLKFQIQNPKSQILSAPLIAALLFAVHPIHTEAVTWIGGIPELSFTLFYLFSFYLYIKANGRWGKGFILSLIFFFLATLCKEPALTLPILLLVYDYSFRKDTLLPLSSKTLYHLLKRYLPYLILGGLYLIIRTYAIGGFAPLKSHAALSNYQYFINVFPLFIQYLEKLIIPINLNALYVFHPILSFLEWKGIITLTITLTFISLVYLFRRNGIVFFSLLWIVIPLLPVFYIPALGVNTLTERYLYLPSVGFVILISLLVERIYYQRGSGPTMRTLIVSMLIIIIAMYSIGTIKRNYIWKDNYTLWADTEKKSPDSYIAHTNLGLAFYDRNLIDKAIEHYKVAIKLNPGYPEAYNNLGLAFHTINLIDEAIEHYKVAIKLNPDFPEAHNNIGAAFYTMNLVDKAIEHYQIVMKLRPYSPETHFNLGLIYSAQGKFNEAIKEYLIGLRLRPQDAKAHNNLGNAYVMQGKLDEAIKEYLIVLQYTPEDAESHNSIANAYIEKGEIDKAVEHYEIALKLRPDYYEAHYSLGLVYFKKGLKQKAEEEFKTALKLRPDFTPAEEALESVK